MHIRQNSGLGSVGARLPQPEPPHIAGPRVCGESQWPAQGWMHNPQATSLGGPVDKLWGPGGQKAPVIQGERFVLLR